MQMSKVCACALPFCSSTLLRNNLLASIVACFARKRQNLEQKGQAKGSQQPRGDCTIQQTALQVFSAGMLGQALHASTVHELCAACDSR